jgi:predicted PP-loop superfamily ATPase
MKSARQRMSDRIGRFDILATQEFLARLQKEKSVRKGMIEGRHVRHPCGRAHEIGGSV